MMTSFLRLFVAVILLAAVLSPASAVVYVKHDSPGPVFDGKSWGTAFHGIQEGVNAAADGEEVWVARGIYIGKVLLKAGVGLYGGFAGDEASRIARKIRINRTVIDAGDSRIPENVLGANSATVDGFTIRGNYDVKDINSWASGSTGVNVGHMSSMTVSNNIFLSCQNGISCYEGSCRIVSNVMAACIRGMSITDATATIVNNTVAGSETGIDIGYHSIVDIRNNIIAFNSTGIKNYYGNITLSHNNLYHNATADYSGLQAGDTDISVDPRFASLEFGDFHIQPDSECRDAGDNSTPALLPEDMDGQNRLDGSGIDVGADESFGEQHIVPTRVIYVNPACPSSGDGSSWSSAYSTIRAATEDVKLNGGAEVWVARSTYHELVRLAPFTRIYGGFVGTETDKDAADPIANRTVIHGDSSAPVIQSASFVTIDGFGVIGGSEGIFAENKSVLIRRNMISYNSWGGTPGCGLTCSGGSVVENNTLVCNFIGMWTKGSITIAGNTVVGHGTAISCNGGMVRICGNTVAGNAIGLDLSNNESPVIANNILAYNGTGIRSLNASGTPTLSHNNFYHNITWNCDGIEMGQTDLQVDPGFEDLNYGGLHIQADSLCRNAGDNSFAGVLAVDIDGQQRINGQAVDIGSDESYGEVYTPAERIRYVDAAAEPGGDGRSWSTAYNKLQNAIDSSAAEGGAEVWVAKGNYAESIVLQPFVYLRGGFAGTETDRGQRDWVANISAISRPVGSTAYSVVMTAPMSLIDGFDVCGGSAGIMCSVGSPAICNNTIHGNGMGIRCVGTRYYSSSPAIMNNQIMPHPNSGIYVYSASAFIDSNTIVDCKQGITTTNGRSVISYNNVMRCAEGGIIAPSSTPVISGNLVANNGPMGISCQGSVRSGFYENAVITRNTIVGQSLGVRCTGYLTSTMADNIIAFNTTGVNAVSTANSVTLSHNNVFGNTTDYIANPDGTMPHDTDISLDPLFANPSAGDYHLLPGSPCIDAGSAENAPDFDLDGCPRPRDGDGDGVAVADIGCYEAPANYVALAWAKGLADGSPVGIYGPVTTALFDGRFYLENQDRVCGVGVLGSVSGTGRRVALEGTVSTVDGERVIVPSLITETGSAPIPLPWYLNFNAIGGGPLGLQAGVKDWRMVKNPETDEWERKLVTFGGANNIGLLIKAAGQVTNIGEGFFYLDGSCSFDDGDESVRGIKVFWSFVEPVPAEGSFVEITAISGCTVKNGEVVRMLRVVSPDAVRVLR